VEGGGRRGVVPGAVHRKLGHPASTNLDNDVKGHIHNKHLDDFIRHGIYGYNCRYIDGTTKYSTHAWGSGSICSSGICQTRALQSGPGGRSSSSPPISVPDDDLGPASHVLAVRDPTGDLRKVSVNGHQSRCR
jgi:hypothetical protein